MLTEARIAEIKKRKDAATTMVSALCKRSFEEGWRRWEMSIPAQPNYDPDLVISASLQDVSDLLAEREELVREREKRNKPTRNSEALASFTAYCEANPGHRFWQALRNWSKWHYIFGGSGLNGELVDTFEIEGLDGTRSGAVVAPEVK